MSGPIPLMVELCAGTAALSLRLHQRKARPPVSRMGAKTGYADAILRVLGLRPGQRAEHYLWCEPDPGVRLLLEAYRDRELALAAAEIIRGWKDEDPRALWERLRAEGPPVCPPVDAREVARWVVRSAWSYEQGNIRTGFVGPGDRRQDTTATATATGVESAPTLPATIADDARTVDPREVARWAAIMVRTMPQAQARGATDGDFLPRVAPSGVTRYRVDAPSHNLAQLSGSMPAAIVDDARPIVPGDLPPGTVAYIDPPYVGTTGYASDLPRDEVVTLARRWADAGAVVCISEAEPIPELVADGWHAVEITGARRGQKRTFSKQQSEWLTLNRPPAWTVPVQGSLFG